MTGATRPVFSDPPRPPGANAGPFGCRARRPRLCVIRLPEQAENDALGFYLEGVVASMGRCDLMRGKLSDLCAGPRFKPYVDALKRLKGVDEITAIAFAATVDDFARFKNGVSVSKYIR